jgi:sulfonate transport system substrate-binding protein
VHSPRRLLAAVPLLVAALLLAGCGGAGGGSASGGTIPAATKGPNLSELVLHVGDQVKVTESVLEASGALKDLPYKIEWSSFTSGPPLLEALNAGAIDVGGVGDTPPVFAQANGANVRIVATSRSKKANDFLLVPKGSPAKDLADLRGKTIAVAQGSSSHGLLLGLLHKAGLSVDDVRLKFLAPPDALSAFSTGQVDAWAVWNPYAALAEQQAGGKVIADGTGTTTGQGYQLASPKALADPTTSAALGDYLGRLAKATAWAADHADQWVPTYAKLTGLPPSVARASFDTSRAGYVPIDDGVIAKQQGLIDLFGSAGLLKTQPKAADFFDARFNHQVEAGASA